MNPLRLEELVVSAAHRRPGHVAVEDAEGTLSYGELLERARGYAMALPELAGRNPRRIALCTPASADTIALYLGILLAGATAVPLSPSAPPARLERILRQADVDLIISSRTQRLPGQPWISTTEAAEVARRLPATTPVANGSRTGQDIAYLIFTSGSTGQPKGVPISHSNVCTFIRHAYAAFNLQREHRVSQFFDLSFDVSIFDIFATLAAGATLVIPDQKSRLQPIPWINEKGITHWGSVPSLIALCRRSGSLEPNSMPDLRLSLFIGEQLSYQAAEAWADAAPNSGIVNFYGPAEATVAVSSFLLPAQRSAWPRTSNRTVPIGSMFPQLQWRIDQAPGWPAEAGELVLAGPQVFGGYLAGAPLSGDPDRPGQPDGWYRTGDIVHNLGDGVLVHLGRIDDQVKIGAYRIEPGEVESHVKALPAVVDAVVVVALVGGELALHAFYLGVESNPRQLRASLAKELPHYMLPHRITWLASFPLTGSGKVDRVTLKKRAEGGEPE